MIKKLDHVAVVVRDLDAGLKSLQHALGLPEREAEVRAVPAVKRTMLPLRNARLELFEPLDPESGQGRFLRTYGQGLYHLCIEVDSVDSFLLELAERGVPLAECVGRQVPVGKIAFLPPQAARGVSIELLEKKTPDPAGPADAPALDAVVLAVASLEDATKTFGKVLDVTPSRVVGDPRVGIRTALFPVGDSFIELVQPTDPAGALARFLAKRGEGLYMLTIEVKDFDAHRLHLHSQGISILERDTATGRPVSRWGYLSPKSASGILIGFFQRN